MIVERGQEEYTRLQRTPERCMYTYLQLDHCEVAEERMDSTKSPPIKMYAYYTMSRKDGQWK